jgi:hypothetical protein
MRNRFALCLAAAALVVVVSVPIAGATPVKSQYDNHAKSVANERPKTTNVKAVSTTAKKAAAKPTVVQSSNDLPFTGLNIGYVLLFGGFAIAAGLGLRGLAARRRE